MHSYYQEFLIRDWQPSDRLLIVGLIQQILAEYGLDWQPEGADEEVMEVEKFYQQAGGQFWVVVQDTEIVGTAAYYPIARDKEAVQIRKMFLHHRIRGRGLGSYLLTQLEAAIASGGWQRIYIETATVLQEAVHLYENHGYQSTTGVETLRCDRIYVKFLDTFQ